MNAMKTNRYATDEARWRAVLERDRNADGAFVYAVRSTGVYCRPSCGARRALRKNVSFHATPEAAERAGYRPCLRCHGTAGEPVHAAAVARACRMIEAREEAPALGELAQAAGLSPHHFQRVFRRIVGISPKAYGKAVRAERVRSALPAGATVTEAIYEAGYQSNSRFYDEASGILGMTPARFRSGGAGMRIQYAVEDCWLGRALVAATEKGVCAILLGDEAGALVQELGRRFPRAERVPGTGAFTALVARVLAAIEQPEQGRDLPLDVQGTAFQKRVWDALRRIPAGTTASYAEVADRIGSPQAVRAVAGACAANHLAVVVPCHRVRRSDGDLSGYRWGVARKRRLLEREGVRIPGRRDGPADGPA